MSGLDEVSRRLVALALEEDLRGGDATASATVPAERRGVAAVTAREPGVVAGLQVVGAVFAQVDPAVAVEMAAADGDGVASGTVVARVRGSARSILAGERTALNLLTHLSGVATTTARYVAAVDGTGCVVRDTRKTLPGLRALQKAAVVAAGGVNHRFTLSDGILVKDNHVAAAGGVAAATRQALDNAGGLPVQVEVDDLAQLDEAVGAGARLLLLDNFSVADMRSAVTRCREIAGGAFVEASGGVTLDTVRAIADTGVDAVAIGALTHSARVLDLGLDWEA